MPNINPIARLGYNRTMIKLSLSLIVLLSWNSFSFDCTKYFKTKFLANKIITKSLQEIKLQQIPIDQIEQFLINKSTEVGINLLEIKLGQEWILTKLVKQQPSYKDSKWYIELHFKYSFLTKRTGKTIPREKLVEKLLKEFDQIFEPKIQAHHINNSSLPQELEDLLTVLSNQYRLRREVLGLKTAHSFMGVGTNSIYDLDSYKHYTADTKLQSYFFDKIIPHYKGDNWREILDYEQFLRSQNMQFKSMIENTSVDIVNSSNENSLWLAGELNNIKSSPSLDQYIQENIIKTNGFSFFGKLRLITSQKKILDKYRFSKNIISNIFDKWKKDIASYWNDQSLTKELGSLNLKDNELENIKANAKNVITAQEYINTTSLENISEKNVTLGISTDYGQYELFNSLRNSISWQDAYDRYYLNPQLFGESTVFMRLLMNDPKIKQVYFFIPPDFGNKFGKYTKLEWDYLQRKAKHLKKVIFVVGAHNPTKALPKIDATPKF